MDLGRNFGGFRVDHGTRMRRVGFLPLRAGDAGWAASASLPFLSG